MGISPMMSSLAGHTLYKAILVSCDLNQEIKYQNLSTSSYFPAYFPANLPSLLSCNLPCFSTNSCQITLSVDPSLSDPSRILTVIKHWHCLYLFRLEDYANFEFADIVGTQFSVNQPADNFLKCKSSVSYSNFWKFTFCAAYP